MRGTDLLCSGKKDDREMGMGAEKVMEERWPLLQSRVNVEYCLWSGVGWALVVLKCLRGDQKEREEGP